ncbi:hypothetical protein [Streptomyces aureocirculatus]|uniref:hypothetical protein n=1 Tax=Streptomyces aureocirculatus TaxID=67275 RepID=UPI0004C5914B|nr:hypothetical protein [Streptomyces aureocirculatus]
MSDLSFPPTRVVGRGAAWYRGDCHVYSVRPDGELTPHWLALGIKPGEVIDWHHQVRGGLIDQCLDQVHRVGGLCVAAHPHAPYPSGERRQGVAE